MANADRSALYHELKEAGVQFDKHFREYSTAELAEAVEALRAKQGRPGLDDLPPTAKEKTTQNVQVPREQPASPDIPRPFATTEMKPVRYDEATGRVWYREEVLKPAYPKPRVRRKLTYVDPGVKKQVAAAGQFMESFEVAGDQARTAEIRVTVSSYQVGLCADRRFPFLIHSYNGHEAFDLFEVANFFGGMDLVPETIKTTYVGNDLCYEIQSTIRTIEQLYRDQNLMKEAML